MEKYFEIISNFSKKKILVIGDVMLDRYLWGKVNRISPEAPIPVVEVYKESSFPGGAANVARNLVEFGCEVFLCGLVGYGEKTDILVQKLQQCKIDVSGLVKSKNRETIVKTRIIANNNQQVVRIDREKISPLKKEEQEKVFNFLNTIVQKLDGVIIQDYGKGFIQQEFVNKFCNLMKKIKREVVITVDPNPNNPIIWSNVHTVKPNKLEAYKASNEVAKDFLTLSEEVEMLKLKLFEKWDVRCILLTLSEKGMAVLEKGRETKIIPARTREVYDVSGAGDTTIAIYSLALTTGANLVASADIANFASSIVVGKVGTATASKDELCNFISKFIEK